MFGDLECLLVREEGAALIITVNRPEAMNALNTAVLNSLETVIGHIEREALNGSARLRAVIITGSGEKAFVAGADIKGFENIPASAATEFAINGQGLLSRLERLPVPVIAAVNGFALGGGLELALACDFIYASENAKFGLPECTLGLMPGYGGTVRLPRRVGPARAIELTVTGAMITAAEALAIGLVNKIAKTPSELLANALETAKVCASRAPLALARIKRSIHEGMNQTEDKANALEARLFGELFATEDKIEGVRAFNEKRKAQFQGK